MKTPLARSNGLFRRLQLIVAVSVFASITASAAPECDSLKLLTIGNSFAQDATRQLPKIVKAAGKQITIGGANIGGCSLERHARHLGQAEANDPEGKAYNGKSLPEILASNEWDIVTIQQASPLSFKAETYQPYADRLIAAVRKYSPKSEIVIHETWAYREDHDFFKKGDFTPAKMYSQLRDAYHGLAAHTGFRILPVGDAFNLARRTPRWTYKQDPDFDFKNPPAGKLPDQSTSLNVGWKLEKNKEGVAKLALDPIHANLAGQYLGACVWYLELFNADKLPDSYVPDKLSAEDAAALREHALAAVKAERARAAKSARAHAAATPAAK